MAIDGLRMLGVASILPQTKDDIRVTEPSELRQLATARGIIVDQGRIVVEFFDGDVPRARFSTPGGLRWRSMLEGARTREEVLAGLGAILTEEPGTVIRSHVRGSRLVEISPPIGADDLDLLARGDRWRCRYRDAEGYWLLMVEFERNVVDKITVRRTSTEFFF